MEVLITGRQLEVTPALRQYVENRAKKIEKYTPKASQITFTLKIEKYRHLAEVLVKVNGFILQSEQETDAMYASVDKAMAKIERQFRKYKEKLCNHRVQHGIVAEGKPPAGGEPALRIMKRKKFEIRSMALSEAALQMELLDKDFFLFGNHEDQHLNVLYKRKDGTLGLIEAVH
ncbi:MAG: ribosome hibernation-promoting factor, HPF/YfiA family [Nitrospiria bacterium]